ncbi:MAG: C39 family peptidase [Tannerellaceae bacterium]|nr:C39 family peptidase [Tannerellaceae bacterium]
MKRSIYALALLILFSCSNKTECNKYYQANDFYSMKSEGSLVLIERFKTYQQTTGVTCGPSCALMILDHFGKLGEQNEMSLKSLRGTEKDTTYLRHLLNIFDAVGAVKYVSTFDYDRKSITPELLRDFLKKGSPVIVGSNEWGGHWQIIIGYDTMGTDALQDDVLILADPYDRTDHTEDGYIVYPLENFIEGIWSNSYDPDFDWGLFVAILPDGQ